MTCTCNVHPGKFEGEPALAALAYYHALNGNSDESADSECGGTTADFFRAPLGFDTDGAPEFARQEGYCPECIAAALESDVYGVGLFYSDYGFVHVETYFAVDEYEDAMSDATTTTEPQPGDYILSPCGRLGSRTYVGIADGPSIGEYDTEDEAEKAIRERMHKEAYYPDVWTISDHGNVVRISDRFTAGDCVTR